MASSGSMRNTTERVIIITGGRTVLMGGHHLQRIIDVDKVRTLIWCRTCSGMDHLQQARKASEKLHVNYEIRGSVIG